MTAPVAQQTGRRGDEIAMTAPVAQSRQSGDRGRSGSSCRRSGRWTPCPSRTATTSPWSKFPARRWPCSGSAATAAPPPSPPRPTNSSRRCATSNRRRVTGRMVLRPAVDAAVSTAQRDRRSRRLSPSPYTCRPARYVARTSRSAICSGGTVSRVRRQHHEIRVLADLQRADHVVGEQLPRRVDGLRADGLLDRQPLLGRQHPPARRDAGGGDADIAQRLLGRDGRIVVQRDPHAGGHRGPGMASSATRAPAPNRPSTMMSPQ